MPWAVTGLVWGGTTGSFHHRLWLGQGEALTGMKTHRNCKEDQYFFSMQVDHLEKIALIHVNFGSWLLWRYQCLLCNLFSPGGNDSTCPRQPCCAHPCAVSAPSLSTARQGLHPLVALPAVPALYTRPPPSSANLRGIPRALLPKGRIQGERAISHLHIQHAIPRDGVHNRRSGVHKAEQRLLVHQSLPHPPSAYSPLTWTQGRRD